MTDQSVNDDEWHAFWNDRLEVGIDLVTEQHGDLHDVTDWVARLSPRCRDILVGRFGIDPRQDITSTRATILDHHEELLPFMLVDAATVGKRTYAIQDVARKRLTKIEFEHCRLVEGGERFDRNALMWLLYLQRLTNLELVFHLDRIQRKGFARMVLASRPKLSGHIRPQLGAFLSREFLQRLLESFESDHRTHRQSHCAEILHDEQNYIVFIKRDYRPTFVAHGSKNTFGFEPEWIVLDFEPDLQRVHICSVSPDAPLILANAIASEYFGTPVEYVNETLSTPATKVVAFLRSLLATPDLRGASQDEGISAGSDRVWRWK